jgi:hypothetical protein
VGNSNYTGSGLIGYEHDRGSGKANPLSQEGFKYSLATGTHGGVQVRGEIRQEAVLNLVALRTLSGNMEIKRYLLGLALVSLSYRDQQGFYLREGCLLRAASKEDYDGRWKSVQFDGTEEPAPLTHEKALAYAKETASFVTFETSQPDEFDKDTVEAWLNIEKKERKTLAKTMHPTEAVARKKRKQAEEDAKNPVDTALKAVKAIKLGKPPKPGKPPKIQTEKFKEVEQILDSLSKAEAVEGPIWTLAAELKGLIQNDQNSHELQEQLMKRLEAFKEAKQAETSDESSGTSSEGASQ